MDHFLVPVCRASAALNTGPCLVYLIQAQWLLFRVQGGAETRSGQPIPETG